MSKTLLLHGSVVRPSSFSIVNRQYAAGFERLGYRVTVMPGDGASEIGPAVTQPDIYLTHDYPYNVLNAPGRLNVFVLAYEYARLLARDRHIVPRLNHFFDLLVVPSHFTRVVCEQSGIRIPIAVCPHGVDRSEFNPNVPPVALPTTKRLKFLYLGGANERKGTDVLLRAFAEEFTADDDVVLVCKTLGYEPQLVPFQRSLERVQRRRHAPEIIHQHGVLHSVAGYYTAADYGVFPFRGEGFALPILECIASGRPVIVTAGGAPLEFCTEQNATFIPAVPVRWRGREQLEPDCAALRTLLRAAYEGKRVPPSRPQRLSATVAEWSWQRTVARMHSAFEQLSLQRGIPRRATSSPRTPRAPRANRATPAPSAGAQVGYAFYQKGTTSWKRVTQVVDRTLARKFEYVPLGYFAPPPRESLKVVLGESGFALEHFLRAAKANPTVTRILLRGNGPFETTVAHDNRERALCGVPPRTHAPIEYWRHTRESTLADPIVVYSQTSKKFFVEAGYPEHKLRVLPLGIASQAKPRRRRARRLRVLYIATTPFRKGIRLLFDAWDALRPKHAELVCIAGTEALTSPLLLRYLVRNPSITFKPLMPRRQLEREYVECDCQVLPTFEDGFPFAIAEGMGYGKPAIVSADSGISDLVVPRENGYIIPTGDVRALKRALASFCDNRKDIPRMGDAAFETARQYPWARFEQGIVDLVRSYLDED